MLIKTYNSFIDISLDYNNILLSEVYRSIDLGIGNSKMKYYKQDNNTVELMLKKELLK